MTLDGGTNDGTGDESDRVYPNVENAVGGSGNDTISADTTATHLVVPNSLDGGPGADTLTGLAGDDTLTGGTGSDTVTGDDGNDTLKLVDATADTGSCGAGNDTAEADEGIDNIAADCETVKRTAVPPPPVTSTITVDNPSATEGKKGTRKLVFTVKLSEAQAAAVGVTFQTADLTATAGKDYAAQSGALAFAAGETLKTVTVAVTGDKIRERDEQLTLQLSAPTGNAVLGSPASGVGTILNDDGVKARRKTPRLLTRVAPRRDRTSPYSFVVTGTVMRPKGVSKTAGCKGKVRVKVGTRKKVLLTRSGFVDNRCNYTVPVRFASSKGIPSSGRLRFVARFLGNKVLKPKTGKRVRARARLAARATLTSVAAQLSAGVVPGPVHLTVADLARSLVYYRSDIGVEVLDEGDGRAVLGAADRELLVLVEEPGARPADGYTGLFHFALLVPRREDLARWLAHAARERVAMTGMSDHDVSEALYLRDPDGHGIEIYADRPREYWEGRVAELMTTVGLDVESLLGELPDPATEPFAGLPAGTVMGHVHLRVADVGSTIAFYRDVLGFELMAHLGSQAAFLAAGGYHHHIGVNTWESAGAPPPPPGSAALRHATIVLADAAERDAVAGRVEQAGHALERTAAGLMVRDPSGNALVLSAP